jgi:hypothetical protein
MSATQIQASSISKAKWLNLFVETFLASSRHFMSERSVRSIALQLWESHQASDPAEIARRWDNGVPARR